MEEAALSINDTAKAMRKESLCPSQSLYSYISRGQTSVYNINCSCFTPHLHWIAKNSEIRSLQLCYRIKETKLLHEFLDPPLWQTYWCPLSIFLCSAQTLRTRCPSAGNTLAQFLTRHLVWTALWHKCCRLCQLFKNYLLSLRDSFILLSLNPTFWKIFLNFCDHSCYQ